MLTMSADAGSNVEATTSRFRAPTAQAALDQARETLGEEVEIVEASRIRRGGVGGFFATDLGVEVVVARRADVAPGQAQATDGPLAAIIASAEAAERSFPVGRERLAQAPAAQQPVADTIHPFHDRLLQELRSIEAAPPPARRQRRVAVLPQRARSGDLHGSPEPADVEPSASIDDSEVVLDWLLDPLDAPAPDAGCPGHALQTTSTAPAESTTTPGTPADGRSDLLVFINRCLDVGWAAGTPRSVAMEVIGADGRRVTMSLSDGDAIAGGHC